MLIYRVMHATEAGVDPFDSSEIRHLREPLEAYVRLQSERHRMLTQMPRITADPEEAAEEFEMLVVPADRTRQIKEVKKLWATRILPSQTPHYHMLALEFTHLPDAAQLDEDKRDALLKLVEYEIRYLRGCNVRWIDSFSGKEAGSGPDYY